MTSANDTHCRRPLTVAERALEDGSHVAEVGGSATRREIPEFGSAPRQEMSRAGEIDRLASAAIVGESDTVTMTAEPGDARAAVHTRRAGEARFRATDDARVKPQSGRG